PLLAVVDVRELRDRTELGPGDGDSTVVDQRRVGTVLGDELPLELAVAENLAFGRVGTEVEPEAPAPAPDTVVPLSQIRERIPGRRAERLDPVAVDAQPLDAHTRQSRSSSGRSASAVPGDVDCPCLGAGSLSRGSSARDRSLLVRSKSPAVAMADVDT